ncbi:MAG TPA: PfkB family carbohydrate kinase [Acidimicrobiales bacterium]|nr:PfkB family carbohydrate kinase [Acidimicrobiales bacterium]
MASPVQLPVVVVIGDVMVDVVVVPLGPFNRGSDTPSTVVVSPGGSAANQAVALAAAGAVVHLVAAVGDDDFGRAAAAALATTAVQAHLHVCPGQRTGVVVALIGPSGERSMLTDRGANLHLGTEALDPLLFAEGRHLHLSGYELLDEATRPVGLAALELAAAAGMTRSVDPSSAGPLGAVGPAAFLSWTGGIEWCCANLDEGRALTGATHPDDVMAALRHYYREVVVTLGAGGALLSGPGTDLLHCSADHVEVADTTGAGDAFTGTFLARRLGGDQPEQALRAGLAAAARVVAEPGARSWS